MSFGLFFETHVWVYTASLGLARVSPMFFMLPFLNNNVLTGVVRNTVMVIVAASVWPYEVSSTELPNTFPAVAIIAQEIVIGLVLGCLIAWPFWVMHALGNIIDNQRGATLSSSIDPANGVDTSEMANFLNLFAAVIYLQNGGLQMMVETVYQSYQLCSPMESCLPSLPPLLSFINTITAQSFVLASPILAVLLLSEIVLGLLSRFAPQMNAFAISLTIKSGIAVLIMLLYFSPVFPDSILKLSFSPSLLNNWISDIK